MSIYNYVRPLWRNGPHVLHDAPPRVRVAFDLLFGRRGIRRHEEAGDEIRVHRVRPLDLSVAWLQVEVELPVAGTSFSYRRARYLHAIAVEGAGERTLSPARGRALFEGVYGRDLVAGIRSAQRWLHVFEHPADIDRGRALFAHDEPRARPFETAERRAPERLQRDASPGGTRRTSQGIGRVALAEAASPPDPALYAAVYAGTGPARAAARPPERTGPSASLSALLHARLSCEPWTADPNEQAHPHGDASEPAA